MYMVNSDEAKGEVYCYRFDLRRYDVYIISQLKTHTRTLLLLLHSLVQDEGISAVRLLAGGGFSAILLRLESLYAVVLNGSFGVEQQYDLPKAGSKSLPDGRPVSTKRLSSTSPTTALGY